ncbi:rho guanine nucleotide exchange factor 12 isoform X2 [Trichomycterus rosablanca]|uniref:rho guanine nucleotide exchange factor 12 isoform X2 n=1 Tax=Trichomycterus rosablanca TaxID=2290929 RepID=UPI002F35476C
MSDTHPSLTDRSSSILSRDPPPDKRPKSDQASSPAGNEFDSTGLVQRCLIIQKDENGFGLTVSGDNPVFVQLVKQDGAAMRAGVQTGDRIIKVNGTLVTQSNHVEVVKLIKSGSYAALTVLGRPPGCPQVPLSEVDMNLHGTSLDSPHSPRQSRSEREYRALSTSPLPPWEMNEDYSRNPTLKLLRDIQQAKKHIVQQQDQVHRTVQDDLHIGDSFNGGEVDVDQTGSDGFSSPALRGYYPASPESRCKRNSSSPKNMKQDSFDSSPAPESEETSDLDSLLHSSAGGPSPRQVSRIIGVEDEYFESEQEQVNVQCSCLQSVELLKTRPVHLAAFLHHVVSQFDPAPVLCYLHADLYKHTNSKETRRVFMDFFNFFIDHGASLKVPVPESISSELERRRPELIPEELHRQYVQTMQETLLPEIQRILEDFRQKCSMGLTLAEGKLTHLDSEQLKDSAALERERSFAENLITRIDEILLPLQDKEEEKCTTIQYVIYTYMKHLGVRVKEQRNLESKRVRIHFLPKIKKSSSKLEKEGEEKVKKPRFNLLGPPRRPSRIETTPVSRSGESKPKPQKQLSQPAMGKSELVEGGRLRNSQSSEGSDLTTFFANSAPYSPVSDTAFRDSDCSPSSMPSRLSDGVQVGEGPEMTYPPCDYLPYCLEQLDEEREGDRFVDEGTPRFSRRMEEVLSDDDASGGIYSDVDLPNWQQLVGGEVLAGLTPQEIKRQEVINELFYTERAHVRMLKVLDNVFYQKLTRDNILPPADIRNIFTNLEEIVQLHVTILDQMAGIRKRVDSAVVDKIGDDLLSWFGGGEMERKKRAVSTFCSNQPFALELIKNRQKKDQRFITFMQEAESNRLCRRLQLKDIIPAEMQRLTKYPLLLENIAKYTGDSVEKDKVKRAADCCRKILNHVNQAVKESENKQRLEDYQRRLDLSSLKQTDNPLISELKNLDLTKKTLIHEGPLTWKLNKDKTVELYTLLLDDILVLLQKQDEKLVLKCHSKNRAGSADTQHIFSPVIKLNSLLVRSVATDNRSFFLISMSDKGAQIYELMAQTVSEQKVWQKLIAQRAKPMNSKPHCVIPLPQSVGERNGEDVGKPARVSERESPGRNHASGKGRHAVTGPASRGEEEDQGQEHGGAESTCPVSELLDGHDAQSFSCRADEALKTLAALKQVLVTELMAQTDGERLGRRLLRTTSLRTSCRTQDTSSGDTGFYEGTEDYSECVRDLSPDYRSAAVPQINNVCVCVCESGYLVLEGSGSGESSTDDDVQFRRKEPGLSRGCAADSGISLRFSSSSGESFCRLSREVLTHLRSLQTDLNHLKEVESRYYSLVRQRQSSADAAENRDNK